MKDATMLVSMRLTFCLAALLAAGNAAARCEDGIPLSGAEQNYVLHNNGTVTDSVSGLMWMQCSSGQTWSSGGCAGNSTKYTWVEALSLANASSYAGYSDWRLPNVKELLSLVEQACISASINEEVFPQTWSDIYWSSSPDVRQHEYAWGVDFYDGANRSLLKNDVWWVRLVRGGE